MSVDAIGAKVWGEEGEKALKYMEIREVVLGKKSLSKFDQERDSYL